VVTAAEAALQERVKELTCLYEIAKLRVGEGLSLDELLQGVVDLLPMAWLHPETMSATLVVDGRSYRTPGASETFQRQTAEVVVGGARRGTVEVGYTEARPEPDAVLFLREERHLLDTVAREVSLILERRRVEEERTRLEEQLRHADRLATIGQLSAGLAHELNEPLGSILGFAQLAAKTEGLPDQVARDIEKIVRATLHARETIKSLLLFARQIPSQLTQVDLNRLVGEGLGLLEGRFSRQGIELVRDLAPGLPELRADPAQIRQVIVNLVVNALQAMPDGGTLTLRTALGEDQVMLVVEDDGVGMSDEVARQILVPFFTTKEVGVGTGLGLSVVHGIVASHGGSIAVASRPGRGTRFEVALPAETPPEVARHG
jgi:two-component system NtrC family sensor kinase